MRWPWSRPKRHLLVVEEVVMPDERDAPTEAVARAKSALEKAQADSDTMHRITKSIYRERQANNFSGAMFRAMRRKES